MKKAFLIFFLSTGATFSIAKGPVGIGKLEIGMTLEAVEKLSKEDEVYLTAPITPFVSKSYTPVPGEEKFDTMISSPLSEKPLKAVLTFSEGFLKWMHFNFEESSYILDRSKDLISSKYGDPKIDNFMKEEQCIYKGGANFKINSGVINYQWTQERPGAAPISTTLSDLIVDICPSNLRYAIGAMKSRSLSIGIAEPKKKIANPF